MTLENRQIISEFKHTVRLTNKTFTKVEFKEIKIKLIKDSTSFSNNIRGKRVSSYDFKNIYFETTIPKRLKDYLLNKLPDYDKFKQDDIFPDKVTKNFITKIRSATLTEIENIFNQMTSDALFLNEVDNLEKLNKVIFIKTNHVDKSLRDNYNFADLNKKVGIDFHYFVCYEKLIKEPFATKKTPRYYGISMMSRHNQRRNMLPLIGVTNLSKYIKVKWTKEREEFLFNIQESILTISKKINDYLSTISDKTFEIVMKNNLLLENKK